MLYSQQPRPGIPFPQVAQIRPPPPMQGPMVRPARLPCLSCSAAGHRQRPAVLPTELKLEARWMALLCASAAGRWRPAADAGAAPRHLCRSPSSDDATAAHGRQRPRAPQGLRSAPAAWSATATAAHPAWHASWRAAVACRGQLCRQGGCPARRPGRCEGGWAQAGSSC